MSALNRVSVVFILSFLAIACQKSKEQPIFSSQSTELAKGFIFTEGPLWHNQGFLLFSDIPANTIYRWNVDDTTASSFISPSGNSNGIIQKPNGNLLLAQHAGQVSEFDGDKLTVIASQYNGKRLNSPNDLVLHSNGTLFFTDPPFGVEESNRELDFSGVYKISPNGDLEMIFDGFTHPNGVALSPDESKLYVNNSPSGEIVEITLDENLDFVSSRSFASVGEWDDNGAADGMITDTKGSVFTTGPKGISVFDKDGKHLEDFSNGYRFTNITWQDSNQKVIYATAPNSVFKVELN